MAELTMTAHGAFEGHRLGARRRLRQAARASEADAPKGTIRGNGPQLLGAVPQTGVPARGPSRFPADCLD